MSEPGETYVYKAAEVFMSASRETDAEKRARYREEGRRLVSRLSNCGARAILDKLRWIAPRTRFA